MKESLGHLTVHPQAGKQDPPGDRLCSVINATAWCPSCWWKKKTGRTPICLLRGCGYAKCVCWRWTEKGVLKLKCVYFFLQTHPLVVVRHHFDNLIVWPEVNAVQITIPVIACVPLLTWDKTFKREEISAAVPGKCLMAEKHVKITLSCAQPCPSIRWQDKRHDPFTGLGSRH